MSRTIQINNGIHQALDVTIDEGKVYVLIGKNGAGKSKLLDAIKQTDTSIIHLKGNYENVDRISTVNKENTKNDQINATGPVHVSSLVAGDSDLVKIFQYYFKILFDADLVVTGGNFTIRGFNIIQDADGFKSIFNLLYYLISEHKVILLDEPERFFHPSMKSVFISLVAEIAKNYNKTILITSHSNESIRFDLDNVEVWLLNPAITNLKQWLRSVLVAGFSSREKQQFEDWISYHTEVFFSKVNCLVEGISDRIVLQALRNKLALKYNLENISVSDVAASNHESGGKSRLYKFQSFLQLLNTTFVIADKDIIALGIDKWFIPTSGSSEVKTVADAEQHKLHILKKGEIEDYYFVDGSYGYCSTVAIAKANKISAAYEQARVISQKSIKEVEANFSEVTEILKKYSAASNADSILKNLSKDYLIDKYARKITGQPHISDSVNGDDIDIHFKFAGHGKEMKFPTASLKEIENLEATIDAGLK